MLLFTTYPSTPILLYVNDIASNMTDENSILFADDTSSLLHDKNLISLLDKTKSSLTKIQSCFLSNKLSLSIEKSHYIVYRSSKGKLTLRACYIKINGSKINRVKEVEYLGLTLDENMNWRTPINKLCSNVARHFSVFFNIRSYMPEKLRKTLYYAFIYSIIQYGIEVYGSAAKTIINQLYVTRNKLLKVLFNKHYRYQFNNLYRELKLHRTVRNNCPELFKDYFKTRETVHGFDTRNKNDLVKNSCKTNYGKRTVHYQGATLWNQLKSKIRETSYSVFKKNIVQKMMSTYVAQ